MDTSAPKMEARATPADTRREGPLRERPASAGVRDPFRLGVRERCITTPDGREVFKQIPLTPEDLVHPQEGDHVSQGLPHYFFLHPQADAMRRYLEKRPGHVVTSDVLLVLRHDGKTSGPDLAVIEGSFDPSKIKGAINLEAVGGRLGFVLEAVSTSEKEIEDKDLRTNLDRYAKEGVEEYFTVYPVEGRRVRDLVGRMLVKGSYVEIPPDPKGRVCSRKLDLSFRIDTASEELVIIDAKTGERLLISDEEEAGRRQEAEARRRAEERAEREAEARRQAVADGLRRGIEDLCSVLGLGWDAERVARVARMSPSQLEALRRHLVNEKRWPQERP